MTEPVAPVASYPTPEPASGAYPSPVRGPRAAGARLAVALFVVATYTTTAACGGGSGGGAPGAQDEVTATPTPTASPSATPTETPRPKPPEAAPKPPRPTLKGRIGEGAPPCSTDPSEWTMLHAVLVHAPDGNCDNGDAIGQTVPQDAQGNYTFLSAAGEPTSTGTVTPPAVARYCIEIMKDDGTGNYELQGASEVFEPGVDPTPTYTVDDICISASP